MLDIAVELGQRGNAVRAHGNLALVVIDDGRLALHSTRKATAIRLCRKFQRQAAR